MYRQPRLSIESLESRALMSAVLGGYDPTPVPHGISVNAFGTLRLKGGNLKDDAHVWVEGGMLHATFTHTDYIPSPGLGGGGHPFTVADPGLVVPAAGIKKIVFWGNDGSDNFRNDTAIKSWANGGNGIDSLVGGSAADSLSGDADEDFLQGRGGPDVLWGGSGNDVFEFRQPAAGTLGSDTIHENANADTDTLDFAGLAQKVTVNLARTSSQMLRTGQYLTLKNALGVEKVIGTDHNDKITGNDRNNLIYAGDGNDTVDGGYGADHLFGESGNDSLVGGTQNDYVSGGSGNDRLLPGDGTNQVDDGIGDDHVDFTSNSVGVTFTTDGGNDTVVGSGYGDKITGSSGNDWIEGRAGNDSLYVAGGNDSLSSGTGNDQIHDGVGDDYVDFTASTVPVSFTSDSGNNTVIGTNWADVLTGSYGHDRLEGRGGNDRLFGKDGSDQLYGGTGSDWLEAGSAAEVADGGGTEEDFNPHKPVIGGTTAADVMQTGLGTCVYLSGLAGAAMQGTDLASRISYLGGYNFQVMMFNPDTETVCYRPVYFDGTIQSDAEGRTDTSAADPARDEFWVLLHQRAYVDMMAEIGDDFTDPDDAHYAVTGREVESGFPDEPGEVVTALAAGKVVTVGQADDTSRIYAHHSYTVMDVSNVGGTWWVWLRNPWGRDVQQADYNAGTHQAYGSQYDGLIAMTWDDLMDTHDFDRLSIS